MNLYIFSPLDIPKKEASRAVPSINDAFLTEKGDCSTWPMRVREASRKAHNLPRINPTDLAYKLLDGRLRPDVWIARLRWLGTKKRRTSYAKRNIQKRVEEVRKRVHEAVKVEVRCLTRYYSWSARFLNFFYSLSSYIYMHMRKVNWIFEMGGGGETEECGYDMK